MVSFDLNGKVALVTGASYGIGFAIAKALAGAGATIVFNDIKQELVDKGLAAYKEAGILVHGYVCDVTDEEAVNTMVEKITAEVGHINILVNNAGITRDGLAVRMKEADFDRVIETSLKGAFLCCKAAARPMMKQRSGRIINLASVVALRGNAGQSNYCAAKAGIIGLTKSLAKELGGRGITVNAIAPGFIETDMTSVLSEDQKSAMLSSIPLARAGRPEDVAEAAAFLAGDGAAYITGQVLRVDGGMAM